jgi:acetoin utilization protein AcuB
MLMPPISRYMTRQPWTVRRDAPLGVAKELMQKHHVRHLPVLEAGEVVGVISERDLYLVDRLSLLDSHLTVDDAMSVEVYGAHAGDAVDWVVEKMAERKLGCAVVLDKRGGAEGIFTTVDALQVLAEMLHRATA